MVAAAPSVSTKLASETGEVGRRVVLCRFCFFSRYFILIFFCSAKEGTVGLYDGSVGRCSRTRGFKRGPLGSCSLHPSFPPQQPWEDQVATSMGFFLSLQQTQQGRQGCPPPASPSR